MEGGRKGQRVSLSLAWGLRARCRGETSTVRVYASALAEDPRRGTAATGSFIYLGPSEMASGGSHLLLSPPSPRTQPCRQPPPLAGCRRSGHTPGSPPPPPPPPPLPGQRFPAARCQAPVAPSSHAQQVQEGGEMRFQDIAFPAPHPTLAIDERLRVCALSVCTSSQQRESPQVPQPARPPVDGSAL